MGNAIIVIGDFWSRGRKNEVRREAAEHCGAAFANLAEIVGQTEYQCKIGTVVYGDDGREHIVDHSGVADHPGDEGHKYIAQAVIRQIQW